MLQWACTEAQGLVEVDLSPILDLFVIVHCCRPLYVVSLGYVTLLKVVPSPLPSWFSCVHWVNTHHEVNPVFGNNTLKNSSGCPLVPCHPFSLTSLPTCALGSLLPPQQSQHHSQQSHLLGSSFLLPVFFPAPNSYSPSILGTQSPVWGPAAVSPGTCQECRMKYPHPRPAEIVTASSKVPRWFINALQFEKHCTRLFLRLNSKSSLLWKCYWSFRPTYPHTSIQALLFTPSSMLPSTCWSSIHPHLHPSWNLQTFTKGLPWQDLSSLMGIKVNYMSLSLREHSPTETITSLQAITRYCHCPIVCARSCPILYDPMDCSPPGSSLHGISWARILEWVSISSSRVSSWPRDQTRVSCIGRKILHHWVT